MSSTVIPDSATVQDSAVDWRDHLAHGRIDPALAAYLRSGEDHPGVQRGLEDLSSIVAMIRAKTFNRARRVLDRLEERGDWFDWASFERELETLRQASAKIDERDSEAALKELDSVTMSIFTAEVANMRGTAYIHMSEIESARGEFARALDFDPKHYRAVTNLGNAALESGNVDEAIEHYEKAIRLNGDFPNAHHNLGVAWRRKGNIGKSISALKAGQRAQSRFEQAEAREQLGRITRGAGRGNTGKYMKWLGYGVIIAAAYWFLSSRGTI